MTLTTIATCYKCPLGVNMIQDYRINESHFERPKENTVDEAELPLFRISVDIIGIS